jgi:hypothetical protein
MNKKKHIDPIPDEFDNYEDAAEFWDSHDTTDYKDNFRNVEAETEFISHYFEIEIEEDIANILQSQAHQKGVTASRLANDLLRQQLTISK